MRHTEVSVSQPWVPSAQGVSVGSDVGIVVGVAEGAAVAAAAPFACGSGAEAPAGGAPPPQRALFDAVMSAAHAASRALGSCAHLQTLSFVPVLVLALLRCRRGSGGGSDGGAEARRALLRVLARRASAELHVLLARLVRLAAERCGGALSLLPLPSSLSKTPRRAASAILRSAMTVVGSVSPTTAASLPRTSAASS